MPSLAVCMAVWIQQRQDTMQSLIRQQTACLANPVHCVQGIVGSAKASIDSVEAACEQVGSSRRLQGLLRAVLAVGNALNTGTARASAEGIKLDSLLKMADVKVCCVSVS